VNVLVGGVTRTPVKSKRRSGASGSHPAAYPARQVRSTPPTDPVGLSPLASVMVDAARFPGLRVRLAAHPPGASYRHPDRRRGAVAGRDRPAETGRQRPAGRDRPAETGRQTPAGRDRPAAETGRRPAAVASVIRQRRLHTRSAAGSTLPFRRRNKSLGSALERARARTPVPTVDAFARVSSVDQAAAVNGAEATGAAVGAFAAPVRLTTPGSAFHGSSPESGGVSRCSGRPHIMSRFPDRLS